MVLFMMFLKEKGVASCLEPERLRGLETVLRGENGVHHEHGEQRGGKDDERQNGGFASAPAEGLTLMKEQGVEGENDEGDPLLEIAAS